MWPGEFVSVMGDNGSGKTTFLQCLLGLVKPIHGSVQVLGQDTRRAPVSRLARQVGYLFQNPDHQLFADSVWEEAVFALRQLATRDGARAGQAVTSRSGRSHLPALTGEQGDAPSQTTQLEALARELLERCGLGQRLDEHPYRLSYGQKRRLNLVSVLCHAPQVILLDELLIGQDPANAQFLLELLSEEAARGAAVVLVNHAPQWTRRYASRLLFLDQGQVAVDAPTDEGFRLLADRGWTAYAA